MGSLRARAWAGVQVACFLLTAVLLNTGLTTMTGGIPTHQDGRAVNTTRTSGVPKYHSTCLEDLDSNNSPFLNLQNRGYVLVGPLLLAMWTCANFKKSVSQERIQGSPPMPTRPVMWKTTGGKRTYSQIGFLFYIAHLVNAAFVIGFVGMFYGIEGKWKMPNSTKKYASACLYNGEEADFHLVIRPEVFMIFAVCSWAVGLIAFLFMDGDDAKVTNPFKIPTTTAQFRNGAVAGVGVGVRAVNVVVVDWRQKLRGFCNLVIFCCTAWTVFSNFDAKTSCGLRNQALYLGVLLYPTAYGMISGLAFDYTSKTVFRPSRISLMLVASAILTQTYISRVRPCDKASPGVKDAIPLVNAGAIFVWMAYEAIEIFKEFLTTDGSEDSEREPLVQQGSALNPRGARRVPADTEGEAGPGRVPMETRSVTLLRPRGGGDMATLRLTSDGGKPNPSGSLQFV